MFKVRMVKVGDDMLTRTFTPLVNCLEEAEIFATDKAAEMLGYSNFVVDKIIEGIYGIYRDGFLMGSFRIRKS